ncbi:MAG: hypothetical protein JNK49_13400 [Planctomycetes bacterium]|nr:hypothetical protein [Planctomycetota bacterium]
MATDSGRLLVFGGMDQAGNHLASTVEYDGQGWITRQPTTSPSARAKAAMVYDPWAKRVLLYGGNAASGTMTDTWAWNGTNWTQLFPATNPAASAWSAMVAHHGPNEGPLLLTNEGGSLMKTWRWAGNNWVLLNTGGLPARVDAAVAHVYHYWRTYVHGGIGRGDMYAWDGANWTVVGQSPTTGPIGGHGLACSQVFGAAPGQLLLSGGGDATGYNNLTFLGTFQSPGQVQWTFTSNFVPGLNTHVPASREYATLTWDEERRHFVQFGGTGNFQTLNDLHARSATGTWQERQPAGPQPTGRVYADMAYDPPNGRVVLFGGANGSATLGDTWSRDSVGWTFHGNNLGPAARVLPALAYRAGTGVMMFGGASSVGGTFFDDTWVWTGTAWQVMFALQRPTARYGHDMVHDTARNSIVMFGGYGGTYRNDTWEFGANGWVQVSGGGGPSARSNLAMAFDRRRNRTVLFGGQSSAGGALGDTWEFQGSTSTWTQRTHSQAPSPRWGHAMDFDPVRGVTVLHGGFSGSTHLNDVWEYDGVTWRQRQPNSTQPATRESPGLAFDTRNSRMVVYGGGSYSNGPYVYRGDTWLYGVDVDTLVQAGPNASAMRVWDAATESSLFGIEFPCPSGIGWFTIDFGVNTTGLALPAQYACSPALAFALSGHVQLALGSPAIYSFWVPTGFAGMGLTVQGFELDAQRSCVYATNPLAVTIQRQQ